MSHQQDQNPGEETKTRNPGMEVMADQSDNGVQSALHMEEGEQPRANTFPSFSRHSSVYSLTLDEFQNTLTGTGRNYGSMNMDDFLESIWTGEENEAQAQNANIPMPPVAPMTSVTNISSQNQFCETSNERPRQDSFSVPASFCQRTVEEVWLEINRTQQTANNFTHAGSKQSDPAYGEMTLKDFLVRAGVVREESSGRAQPPPPPPPPLPFPPPPQLLQLQPQPQFQLPYGMYVNCNRTAGSSFMILGSGGAGSVNVPPPFKALPQIACYGGGVTDNACGTESLEQMSSVCSDGIGMSKPGKKRNRDGSVERVFERRKNRMIKNRESATRSRAKKHAYTIELEAELNHLRDENAYLRHRLNTEAAIVSSPAKPKDKLGLLRRCLSSPF